MEYFIADGMKNKPMGMPLMAPAWDGCMHWAFGQPEIRLQWETLTGKTLPSELDLDKAYEFTREEIAVVTEFVDWATEVLWGTE